MPTTKMKSAEEWIKLQMEVDVKDSATDEESLARVAKFYRRIQIDALEAAIEIVNDSDNAYSDIERELLTLISELKGEGK